MRTPVNRAAMLARLLLCVSLTAAAASAAAASAAASTGPWTAAAAYGASSAAPWCPLVNGRTVAVSVSSTDGRDDPDCGLPPAPPCASLKYVLEGLQSRTPVHATPVVTLAPGVYGGADNCGGVVVGQDVVVLGGAGPHPVVLDCSAAPGVRGLKVQDASVCLGGFHITGGAAMDADGGGAVAVLWPNITSDHPAVLLHDMKFTHNNASVASGGAVNVVMGRRGGLTHPVVSIEGCTFEHNTVLTSSTSVAVGGGAVSVAVTAACGGLSHASISVTDSYFVANLVGGNGGGMLVHLAPAGVLHATRVVWTRCVFTDNVAASASGGGGAMTVTAYPSGPMTDTMFVLDGTVCTGNVAADNGFGGAFLMLLYPTAAMTGTSMVVQSSSFRFNSAASGDGGALFLNTPDDRPLNQFYASCPPLGPYVFREWESNSTITFRDTDITSNTAPCATCTGGGVSTLGGGMLVFSNVTLAHNAAGLSGGGVFLSSPSFSLLTDNGTFLANNAAPHGAQLYSESSGALRFHATTVNMTASAGTQVVVELGGNVSAVGSLFRCPTGSRFIDSYGRYDSNVYPQFLFDWGASAAQDRCAMLVSRLSYECRVCPDGEYTLSAGHTDGTVAGNVTGECRPCPAGAVCHGGGITAAPGHWGSETASGAVVMTQCPAGYCCIDGATCSTFSSCVGNRVGPLCGACRPGFAVTIGSADCVESAHCDDAPWVVPLAIVLALCAAAWLLAQAEVWHTVPEPPCGRVKLLAYFFQMSDSVLATRPVLHKHTQLQTVIQTALSVVKIQVPKSGLHACAMPSLTDVAKVCLDFSIPLAVLAGMLVILGAAKVLRLVVPVRQRPAGPRRWLCQRMSSSAELTSPTKPLLPASSSSYSDGLSAGVPSREASGAAVNPGVSSATGAAGSSASAVSPLLPSLPFRDRMAGAVLLLFLLAYFSFVSASFDLLRCVPLRGGGRDPDARYLFFQATTRCAYWGWQAPILVLAVLLALFPAGLARLGMAAKRRRGQSTRMAALHRAICGPYTDAAPYFDAVLVAHRLVLAALAALVVAPVVRATCMLLATVVVFVLHVVVRPIRRRSVDIMQTVLLACLTVVCATALPSDTSQDLAATARQLGLRSAERYQDVIDVVTVAASLVIPLAAFCVSWSAPRFVRRGVD